MLYQINTFTFLPFNQDYTFHSVSWFFLSIPFIVLFVWHTCLECQMIAACSVTGGTESFASQDTECSVVGGVEGFGSEDSDCSVVGVLKVLGHIHGWFCISPSNSSSCSSSFLQMGQCSSHEHFCSLLGYHHSMGDCCN